MGQLDWWSEGKKKKKKEEKKKREAFKRQGEVRRVAVDTYIPLYVWISTYYVHGREEDRSLCASDQTATGELQQVTIHSTLTFFFFFSSP